MLINMVAGLSILAYYVYRGLDDADQRKWVPAFAITGLVAVVTGMHMSLTWPLTGSYNIAFGEMSVLFGILFSGAALALGLGWDLFITAIYAFFAGLAAFIVGLRIIDLGITRVPVASAIGYILTGLGGIFAAPTLYLRSNRTLRLIGALVLLIAAAIWAYIGYKSYWVHLESFSKWLPSSMR